MTLRAGACVVWLLVTLITSPPAIAQNTPAEYERLGRDLLRELIQTNTTHSTGSVTAASELMAARLIAAGFPKAYSPPVEIEQLPNPARVLKAALELLA